MSSFLLWDIKKGVLPQWMIYLRKQPPLIIVSFTNLTLYLSLECWKYMLSKMSSTFRTIFKILPCGKSAITASLSSWAVLLYALQMFCTYFHILSSLNASSKLWIQLVYRIAACCTDKISFVPLKAWNEKQRKYRVCHKNYISPIGTASITNHDLIVFELFLPLRNSYHKKHSFSFFLLQPDYRKSIIIHSSHD